MPRHFSLIDATFTLDIACYVVFSMRFTSDAAAVYSTLITMPAGAIFALPLALGDADAMPFYYAYFTPYYAAAAPFLLLRAIDMLRCHAITP